MRARLLVVIPTRNRPSLALAAIRSVLASPDPDLRVVVSDNSTNDADRSALAAGVREIGDFRLTPIAPEQPSSMVEHWDFAFDRCLAMAGWTHLTVVTDRMVAQHAALDDLTAIVASLPERVVSYNIDRIVDLAVPVELEQQSWTGRVVEIESRALLHAASRLILPVAIPKQLNSVIPRAVLETLRRRFPGRDGVIAPDFRFAFRCLATFDRVLFYDRSVLVHYALARSNGYSQSRGVPSPDGRDFEAARLRAGIEFATPMPHANTVINSIAHEYESVRVEAPASVPPMHADDYFAAMEREISSMADGPIRTALRADIDLARRRRPASAPADGAGTRIGFTQAIFQAASGLRSGPLAKVLHAVARRVGASYAFQRRSFPNVEAALEHALTRQRPRRRGRSTLEMTLPRVRVARAATP